MRHSNSQSFSGELQERVADLERQLSEARADLAERKAELSVMRHEHAIWEKHGLSQIVKERDTLKAAVEKMRGELAKIAKYADLGGSQSEYAAQLAIRLNFIVGISAGALAALDAGKEV